ACAFAFAVSENIRPQVAQTKADHDFLLGFDCGNAAAYQMLCFATGYSGIEEHIRNVIAWPVQSGDVASQKGIPLAGFYFPDTAEIAQAADVKIEERFFFVDRHGVNLLFIQRRHTIPLRKVCEPPR